MITTKQLSKFHILTALYAGILIISNILANKIIMPFGVVLPCAVILFPMVYILSDILTECYGIRLSMQAVKTNAFLNIFMSVIFMIAVAIPAAPFYENNDAFNTILGNTPRMVIASLFAYYFGDSANSYSLSFLKAKCKNIPIINSFFFRSIGSSLIGQIFDTGLFIAIAFYDTVPMEAMFMMMLNQYIVKIGYEVICFPLTRTVVMWWKKYEQVDVVDNW